MPEASDTLCQTRRVREYEKGSSAPRRTIWKWIGLGLVAVLIGLFSVQYLHPLFPIEEKASCTVTSPSEKGPSTRYNRDLLPRLTTDCGTFSADSAVTCTADPSRKVLLGVGATFDLRVRGVTSRLLVEFLDTVRVSFCDYAALSSGMATSSASVSSSAMECSEK